MSIRSVICDCVQSGRLIHLSPLSESVPVVRHVFVSESISDFLNVGPWEDQEDEQTAFKLRSDFDVFTSGGLISVASEPFKKPNDAFMAPIDPVADCIFSIRNRSKPATRVLGAFAERDVFVALAWDYRRNLGGPNDREWRDLREQCKADWNQRFGAYLRLTGDTNDLASNITVV